MCRWWQVDIGWQWAECQEAQLQVLAFILHLGEYCLCVLDHWSIETRWCGLLFTCSKYHSLGKSGETSWSLLSMWRPFLANSSLSVVMTALILVLNVGNMCMNHVFEYVSAASRNIDTSSTKRSNPRFWHCPYTMGYQLIGGSASHCCKHWHYEQTVMRCFTSLPNPGQ